MATVLVHIDLDGITPDPSSLAALAAGRILASAWGAALVAAVIVEDAEAVAAGQVLRESIGRAGADRLVIAPIAAPPAPLWAALGPAWIAVVDRVRPRIVLFGADAPAAIELGPRTAARLGARLLWRARAAAGDQMELRDREGTHVRASDSGAAVALVAAGARVVPGAATIDVVALGVTPAADSGITLVRTSAATPAQMAGVVVALSEQAGADSGLRAGALALARTLGATLLDGARTDRHTPLAPELCIAIGGTVGELAGGAAVVRIGGPASGKGDDGALDGAGALAELVAALEPSAREAP